MLTSVRSIKLHFAFGRLTTSSIAAAEASLLPFRPRCRKIKAHQSGTFAPSFHTSAIAGLEYAPAVGLHQSSNDEINFAKTLPIVCPGCGGLSQTVEPDAPGFYSQKKRRVQKNKRDEEDSIYQQAMVRLSGSMETSPRIESASVNKDPVDDAGGSIIICDRCHDLLHHSKGMSILHPSMQSIQSIIESSPHKHNHIYHVLDAADFPLSLIPNLMSTLNLPRLRTQNRRSKSVTHTRGRVADVSFIITRSDLLAPQKEQVDHLMPYLQDVLRNALGRTGKNVRLGNVRCVSAKRGWWTPHVKQEIWERGGAGWFVGRVNVGKSALFEAVFPKGRSEVGQKDARLQAMLEKDGLRPGTELDTAEEDQAQRVDGINSMLKDSHGEEGSAMQTEQADERNGDEASLLPPAQPEMQYPEMPIVSALPGTTASPIRIPFGRGKGELIDLPGVQRSSLETHVMPQHHPLLVMKSRVTPDQYTIKSGQSLLLSGIVRITPKTEDVIILAYPFTPLDPHVTGNQKAIAIQTGVFEDGTTYNGTVQNVATDIARGRMRSAGTVQLAWDVTKQRAGPLTDKAAGKQKAENLPFIVYGADILIEGVGWVELVCQVRNRQKSLMSDALSADLELGQRKPETKPEVEVFTPKGKFIGVRQPMNAWLNAGQKRVAKHARRVRPRMSISMNKRREGGRKSSAMAT